MARAIAFVVLLYAANVMGPGPFGDFSLAYAAVGIGLLVADLGLTPLVLRRLSAAPGDAVFWTAIFVNGALAVMVYGGLVLIFAVLYPGAVDVVLIIGTMLPIQAVASSTDALLIAHGRLPRVGLSRVAGNVVMGVTAVGALSVSSSAAALAIGFTIGNIAKLALSCSFARPHLMPRRVELHLAKGLLRSSLPFAAAGVASFLYFRSDVFLLGIFSSAETVGVYSVAYRFLDGLILVPGALAYACFPGWTRNRATVEEITRVLRACAYVGIGVGLTLAIAAPLLIGVLVGNSYQESERILQILALCIPVLYADVILVWLAYSRGHERGVAAVGFSALGVSLLVNAVLIPRYGGAGAAVTTGVSELAALVGYILLLRRQVGRRIDGAIAREAARMAICGIPVGVLVIAGVVAGVPSLPLLLAAVAVWVGTGRAVGIVDARWLVRRLRGPKASRLGAG